MYQAVRKHLGILPLARSRRLDLPQSELPFRTAPRTLLQLRDQQHQPAHLQGRQPQQLRPAGRYFVLMKRGLLESSRSPLFSVPDWLFGSSFALLASRRIALLALTGASGFSSSFHNSSLFSSSGSLGSLLVGVAAAAYHSHSSENHNERKNLFHSFKRLKLVVLHRRKVRQS